MTMILESFNDFGFYFNYLIGNNIL